MPSETALITPGYVLLTDMVAPMWCLLHRNRSDRMADGLPPDYVMERNMTLA